jgi:hypothetical protein
VIVFLPSVLLKTIFHPWLQPSFLPPIIFFYSNISFRSCEALRGKPLALLIPAVGIIAFAAWGLEPLMCLSRTVFLHVFIQIFYHALS